MAIRGGALIQGSRWGATTPANPSGKDGAGGGTGGIGGGDSEGGSSSWKPTPPASTVYTGHPTGTITLSTAVGNGGTIDALFHPTTQKVVKTSNGTLFAVYLSTDETTHHNPSTWQLKKSTDGGTTWTLMWNSSTQGDPQYGISPALELDENDNLYVIGNYETSGQPQVMKFYKFTAASSYSTAITPITLDTSSQSSGKWGVFLDQGRQWIWVVLWANTSSPNLFAYDYTGTKQYSKNIFKTFSRKWTPTLVGSSDAHGEPAYPSVSVGTDGTVYVAWNTMACEAGDFTNAALSYYDVRMVYSTSTKAQFQAGTDTWNGPTTGISGTPSTRTLPLAGDDSGAQAETAYMIVKTSNTTDEFIPASNTNYGFNTGNKYNFNRLFSQVPNNGAVHFYYESETSDVRALQHHSYARFRMSTHDIADGERRTPEWHLDTTSSGDRLSSTIVGQGGGVFVQDTTQSSRLYFVTRTSRDLDEKLMVLRSDDAGLGWFLYATSAAVPGGGSNGLLLVQGYRWVATDGTITGIVQLGDSPYTVYVFTVSPA